MGAGKTTVGRALAKALGTDFHDTDQAIEQATGLAIPQIFATHGEPHFRELERQAVARALSDQCGVVALGGGAVMHPATQEALAGYRRSGGKVVFLDVTWQLAARRLDDDGSRPMLAGNAATQWADLMAQRRPAFEAVANWAIMTDGLEPGAVARRIAARLAS
jgi:shikimate kinase